MLNVVWEPQAHKGNRGAVAFVGEYTLRVWEKGRFARWRVTRDDEIDWRGRADSCPAAQECATVALASAIALTHSPGVRLTVLSTEKRSDMRAVHAKHAIDEGRA